MAEPTGASPRAASPPPASPLVVVAAGGTGGHLFPAEALSIALAKRGITVDLATDERATTWRRVSSARDPHRAERHVPRSQSASSPAPRWCWRAASCGLGLCATCARRRHGFGGYPTIPLPLAAWLTRIPT
jgi:UDP-N-acetylglucosamine--N-acetylmuramyl-(pentapeptide) pyrophosphoryl-undecaprenol N-acetylglucosamine transferase